MRSLDEMEKAQSEYAQRNYALVKKVRQLADQIQQRSPRELPSIVEKNPGRNSQCKAITLR